MTDCRRILQNRDETVRRILERYSGVSETDAYYMTAALCLAEEAAKEAENAESEETVSEDEVILHG